MSLPLNTILPQYRSGLEKHSRLWYTLVFCEPKLLEITVRHILIFLAIFLLSSSVFGQSEETCYVAADSKDFDRTLLSNISVSLISEFLKEVEPIPPAGISMNACVYQIDAVKVKDTTFVTFKGKNLNSYGNSKLSGPECFESPNEFKFFPLKVTKVFSFTFTASI